MEALLVVSAALIIDQLCGEPRRFHPLVGFGFLVAKTETHFQKFTSSSITKTRALGLLAVGLMLLPFIVIGGLLSPFSIVFDVFILYLAIGWKSLENHAFAIYLALQKNDLADARKKTAKIVSRDSQDMDEEAVLKATLESVLENGNDAIFAAIFWYVIAGIPGLIAYRLANTLDAMWGYKTSRYLHFGWAAARLDDVMNYIPARLTALSYALAGHFSNAWRCWRKQANQCASPNAGPVITSGAGSLRVILGGPCSYHGILQNKPVLGLGASAKKEHIPASLNLLKRVIVIWLSVLAVIALVSNYAIH